MNPLLDESGIQTFLRSFPSASRRRGQQYFANRAVEEVSCVIPDAQYLARVRGTEDYVVEFEYDQDNQTWYAECSCFIGYECKHAYAGMLALKLNAANLTGFTGNENGRRKKQKVKTVTLERETPQPTPSPLATALAQGLNRKLSQRETDYVRMLQGLFRNTKHAAGITVQELRQLSPEINDFSWQLLELWDEPPKDDLVFWLYCAWELRRREASIPEFMQCITDFSGIEVVVKARERRLEIERWRLSLENGSVQDGPKADPVDFRLQVLPGKVRVQWKSAGSPDFKDLKQAHLRRLGTDHSEGGLAVVPEALPLWLAIYRPYDFHSACHFDFDHPSTVKMLRQVLSLPGLANRIVTADGNPLERPTDPLRYRLLEMESANEDYQLGLVRADGSPAPPILLAVPGAPAQYLTEHAVYSGPPPHTFGVHEPLDIPAPALESASGIRFLQRLQVELPPRLAQRTRPAQARVKLTCELKRIAPHSDTEAVFLRVTSKADGEEPQECADSGWRLPRPVGWPPAPMPSSPQRPLNPKGNELITIIDRSAQRHFPSRLDALGAKWEEYLSTWRVRLTKSFPETFLPWLDSLPPEVEVHLDRQLATLRGEPVAGTVRLDLDEAGVDWFDLKVALTVSDMTLTPEELKLLLNARGGYVRLGKKGWRRLQFDLTPEEDERLARLGLNARDFTDEPQRLHALQLADDAARKFLPEATAEKIHRRVAELKTRVTPAVPSNITAELRPYQVSGFHFLAYLTTNRFGGVLADDMGLGKTLQTLAWLNWLRQPDAVDPATPAPDASSTPPPALVVCPKSVMDNWRAEAQRFCPGLRVRLWAGEEASELPAARAEADLLVLNYSQLRALSPEISHHHWLAAILDEAQYIKNPDSQTAQIARTLRATHRLALTGTPIENRLLDLWSILAFAMPGVLGNRTTFARSYNQQEDALARRRLAARVRPFLLRRTKSQVAQDLPDRVEEDLLCEMEGAQKTLYRAEFKRAQQMLLSVHTQRELNEQRFNFLTSLLRLRQICCHPALVSAELHKAESAKLEAVLELIEPVLEEGHKVLVFSQFVAMLDILRSAVKERGWNHFYLAGDTENRGELVSRFQSHEGGSVFLISLKAGGFGLNLTAASYVVLFDPWWNPAVEMQAIDRTHRIGQTSKVMAYRLLMKDSIEQKIRSLQRAKAALAEDVLGEERFSQSLTLDDLRFLFADE